MVCGIAVTVKERNLSHLFRNAFAAVQRDIQGRPQQSRRSRSVCYVISCAIIHPIPFTEGERQRAVSNWSLPLVGVLDTPQQALRFDWAISHRR